MGQSVGRRRRRRRRWQYGHGGYVGGGESAERSGQGARFARTSVRQRAQGVPEAAKSSYDDSGTIRRRCGRESAEATDDRRNGRTDQPGAGRRRWTGTGRGTATDRRRRCCCCRIVTTTTSGRPVATAATVPLDAVTPAPRLGRTVQVGGPQGRLEDRRAVHQPEADRHRGHDATGIQQVGRADRVRGVCAITVPAPAASAAAGHA